MTGRLHTKLAVALIVLAGLGGASAARASVVVSVNANFLDTAYDGAGLLAIFDHADIVVEFDDSSQMTYAAGLFNLAADLVLDRSAAGLAMADFGSGTVTINDSGGGTLLAATDLTLTLTEVVDGGGMLAGDGQFTVTSGALAPAFGDAVGEIVQITFHLNPKDIGSFGEGFAALSNVSLMPTPEPATLFLLAAGLGTLLVRRRRA